MILEKIVIEPASLYQMIITFCVTITTISAAIAVIVRAYSVLKKPEKTQNERIEALEKKVERYEQLFDNDNRRLIELEKGNRVMQQSMLALLSHALNGNDVDSLKKAKENLENYLISRESD